MTKKKKTKKKIVKKKKVKSVKKIVKSSKKRKKAVKTKAISVEVIDVDENKTRKDYEFNHELISNSFFKLMIKNKRKPTYRMIEKDTELNYNTIVNHMKTLVFKPMESRFRVLTDKVNMALFARAMKGNAAAIKLWYQLMEGFAEKRDVTVTDKGMEFGAEVDSEDAMENYKKLLKGEE